jgi:hypothetical protein
VAREFNNIGVHENGRRKGIAKALMGFSMNLTGCKPIAAMSQTDEVVLCGPKETVRGRTPGTLSFLAMSSKWTNATSESSAPKPIKEAVFKPLHGMTADEMIAKAKQQAESAKVKRKL